MSRKSTRGIAVSEFSVDEVADNTKYCISRGSLMVYIDYSLVIFLSHVSHQNEFGSLGMLSCVLSGVTSDNSEHVQTCLI